RRPAPPADRRPDWPTFPGRRPSRRTPASTHRRPGRIAATLMVTLLGCGVIAVHADRVEAVIKGIVEAPGLDDRQKRRLRRAAALRMTGSAFQPLQQPFLILAAQAIHLAENHRSAMTERRQDQALAWPPHGDRLRQILGDQTQQILDRSVSVD